MAGRCEWPQIATHGQAYGGPIRGTSWGRRLPMPMEETMRHVKTPRPVHSLAEIALGLKVMVCPNCGGGPMVARSRSLTFGPRADEVEIKVVCRSCLKSESLLFTIADVGDPGPRALPRKFDEEAILAAADVVNPTDQPSALVDVAGWLMLHSLLTDKVRSVAVHARTGADRQAIRNLQILAGQCIDEALKFYEADNDLPPQDAFFSEAGRIQFHAYPELFVRNRLIDLRSRLPSRAAPADAGETASSVQPPPCWWRFWRRG